MTTILRTSCWVDLHQKARLEIVIEDGERRPTVRVTFTDREQLMELSEKLRLVGESMQREARL
jgi:hypothetical protein